MAGVAMVTLFSAAAIADTGDRKDLQVFNDVSKSVTRYSHFTVFDNVDANVKDGVVTLTGQVTMEFKRDDIEKRVTKVDGVKQVNDKITVLPVSQFDDQLRYRIARAIYSNPNFWNYAIGPNPPIHIVVDHSHVTLEGVVLNDMDRIIARSIASNQFGVMSVKNNLKTDAEAKDALEKAF
jgi:osmotically-inducible protein OsmY